MTTAANIIERARKAGLSFRLSAAGKLCLHGPRSKATKELLQAVKGHRKEICARLGVTEREPTPWDDLPCPGKCPGPCSPDCAGGPSPAEELLYPSGMIAPRYCVGAPDVGAGWTRGRGEAAWRPIPGREELQVRYVDELTRQGLIFAGAAHG